MSTIQFITGTDTGVGKTVWTAHWLHALREGGVKALGMKPFCTGGDEDVQSLQRLQPGELSREQCNPYHFTQPLAPGVAAKLEGRRVRIGDVVRRIERVAGRCEMLLVEGAGGVMVPIGGRWLVMDLIKKLGASVVVVARDSLGTINHTLLTVRRLKEEGIGNTRVVMMDPGPGKRDASTGMNQRVVEGLLGGVRVVRCPWFGVKPLGSESLANNLKKTQKVLEDF